MARSSSAFMAGNLVIMLCSLTCVWLAHGSSDEVPTLRQPAQVHTVITGGCSKYFDWQVLGFAYRSGHLAANTLLLNLLCVDSKEACCYCRAISSDFSILGMLSRFEKC